MKIYVCKLRYIQTRRCNEMSAETINFNANKIVFDSVTVNIHTELVKHCTFATCRGTQIYKTGDFFSKI